ncbi:MAG: ATP-dependent Clp protease proteolytic subunit [Chloroflexi bacterium]|nr:ATP-dependent Clp protease proteolytic subunit [Chloroflexota bacterium]
MITVVRVLSRLSLAAGTLGFALALVAGVRGAAPTVTVLPTTGVVDTVMAGYVEEGVRQAAADGAAAVVIELNTPGGTLDATQKIVSALLEAPLPTIVWVAPSGGRAASAGTFITLAGHVALMAPGTNIGAASPVGSQGEDIEGTMGDKVRNDAVANIRAIAEARGRNADWAERTVTEALSVSAVEAVDVGAVDGLAASIEEVLAFADGLEVTVQSQPWTIETTGAVPVTVEMNPFQALLHLLSEPNIAFLLFTLGSLGLVFELQNPNFVTGIIGVISIVLAFIGFGSLPLNVGGLLLIVLAIVLLVLEVTVTSHGLLTVGAIVCFALGASALYTAPGTPTAPTVEVAFPVLATAVVGMGAIAVLIAVVAYRTRRMKPSPVLVGSLRAGEEWTARTVDRRALPRGTKVRVVAQDGLTLVVEPAEGSPAG